MLLRKLIFSTLVCLLLFSFANNAQAQNVQNFEINSFQADYFLSRNDQRVSELKVVEKIEAIFPNFNQNRGIERALPKTYKGRNVNLKIESVVKEDQIAWNYTTYESNDNLIVRIGDKNKFVQGRQQYIITYTLSDVITAYDTHDEWYWDVNGDQWSQKFKNVSATIRLSDSIASELKSDKRCFTGKFGSNSSDCVISQNGNTIVISSKNALFSKENLSFVLAFNKGTFKAYQPNPFVVIAKIIGYVLLLAGPIVLSLIFMISKWHKTGKDPKGRGTIVPEYSVPQSLNPLLADYILNEDLSTKAISASLLNLCVHGYVKLYEVEEKKLLSTTNEYQVELIKPVDTLSAQELKVVDMLFTNREIGKKVNLNDLKNKLYKETKSLQTSTAQIMADLGYFVENPDNARKKYAGWGALFLIIGFASLFFFPPALLFTGGIGVAGIIILIAGEAMPKRTELGVKSREQLKGVEMYMKLAESERIKYLQAPDTAEKIDTSDKKQLIKLYEKLLPYAVLFGIEKEWAKQFADLYGKEGSPGWYSGHTAFNALMFSNAISGFNTVAASSFSSPSSSGSSGFSSGGGFSGGGGGGGGGGGW